jgi:hypothetical protein
LASLALVTGFYTRIEKVETLPAQAFDKRDDPPSCFTYDDR